MNTLQRKRRQPFWQSAGCSKGMEKTKGESDMGWILGITAAVGILLAGIAGLACVAVYRVRECQND